MATSLINYENNGHLILGTVTYSLPEITGGTAKKIIWNKNSRDLLMPEYAIISATTMTTGFTLTVTSGVTTSKNSLFFTWDNTGYVNSGYTFSISLPMGNVGYGTTYVGVLSPLNSTKALKGSIFAYDGSGNVVSPIGKDIYCKPQAGIVGGIGTSISITLYASLL